MGLSLNIQTVKANGTIYIRSDGSIDPPVPQIQRVGDVYTFTGDINDYIVVQRDNMTLDGDGYTLRGTGSGNGIYLSGTSNVIIRNIEITAFCYGIRLDSSGYNTISGNNITANNCHGIGVFESSNHNSISRNNITNNEHGIVVSRSLSNSISTNMVSGSRAFLTITA